MSMPLTILVVEDQPDDAEFLVSQLRQGEIQAIAQRVHTEAEFICALMKSPDVILINISLSPFHAARALELVQEQNRSIPVILIVDPRGEAEALALLQQGAVDYVMKDRLLRLPEAVRRALEEKSLREEKERSETRNELLSILGGQLSSAKTMGEAARIIVNVADKFFGWDCCYLDIYSSEEDRLYAIVNLDVIDGRRQEIPLEFEDTVPSPFIRRVMSEGAQLILREEAVFNSDLTPIGNRSRPSASLMFAPIRHDARIVGIFSVQSYSYQAYDDNDLKMLQFLTDFCGATLERMLAQDALRTMEENYRQLVEQVPAIAYTVEFKQSPSVSYISPRVETILGFSAEEWLTHPNLWIDQLHPDDRERVGIEFALRDNFSQPINTDYRLLTRDGQIRWFHDQSQLTGDSHGKPLHTHGLLFDITERKRAETERQVLLEIMQGLAATDNLREFMKLVHLSISKVIHARNFFALIYNEHSGLFEEAYSVDEYDAPAPPSKLEKSVSAYVFRTGQPLLLSAEDLEILLARGDVQLVGTKSPSWLGVPLKKNNKTIGVMVVQDYEQPNRYSEQDKDFLTFIAGQVGLAIERVQAEVALQASEEHYRLLFENNPLPIWVYDPKTLRLLAVNEASFEHYGYQRDEFLAQTLIEMHSGEERSCLRTYLSRPRQVKEKSGPWKHRKKDGTLIDVEIVSHEIIFHGQPARLALINDITERRKSELALMESEKRFRGLFDTSPDAILLIDPHHAEVSWPIVDCNPAACHMNGFPREELIGQSIDVINIEPGSREERAEYLERLRREGVIHNETFHRRKDGHTFPIEVSTSLITLDGRELILGIDRDITRRKRAEEETQLRLGELEAVSRISTTLRAAQTLDEMLPRLMEETVSILKCSMGSIWLYDQTNDEIRPMYQHSQGVELPPLRSGETIIQDVITSGQVYLSRDLKNDPKTPDFVRPHLSSHVNCACVPIRSSDTIIGALFIICEHPQQFSDADIHLLTTLAEIAGNAVHRMHLHEQTRQRAEEFAKLYETAHELAGQTDLSLLLNTIIDRATSLLGASNGTIALYDPIRGDLELVAAKNFPVALETRRKLGQGMAGRVAQTLQPMILENYTDWEYSIPELKGHSLTSAIEVPMIYHGGLVGTLGVGEVGATRKFTENDQSLLSLFAAQAAGAVQNAKLFYQTRQRLQRIAALHAIDTAISNSFDLKHTLPVILEQVIKQLSVDACDILLLNPESNSLKYGTGVGFSPANHNSANETLLGTLAESVVRKRDTIAVPDVNACMDVIGKGIVLGDQFRAYYGVPLISKERVVGVLEIFHRQPLAPASDWLDYLETIAGQAAIAIDNAVLFRDLQQSNQELSLAYDATIAGWSRALDLRDKETEGHTQRVTTLTVMLARGFGMTEDEIVNVRRGALLHDIGKMGIPDSILFKPGPLTENEWQMMRQHPVLAYEMLSPIEYLRAALDIPYCHHEKWDGTGYPRGLRGEEIPLAARIFAVVDVWDALRSNRPYRQAWASEQVIEHIRSLAGTHFDPRVVEIVLRSGVFGDIESDLTGQHDTCLQASPHRNT